MKQLLGKIEVLNRREKLFKNGDSLLLGVSGGPDSVALLELFCKLRRKHSLRLSVAHLNHGLSKKDGKSYEALTRKLCEKSGVPFYSKNVDVKKLSRETKRSIEETGRIERYAFFETLARKIRADRIVTAHTLDDQAETVLMRILRGTGLKGLAGIPPKRKEGCCEVIRPLLLTEKADLKKFLRKTQVPFCVDKTNRDVFFMRNRVRRRLLPFLAAGFNPRIKESLANLGAVSRHAQDYLDGVSEKAFRRCVSKRKGRVSLKLSALRRLHPAIQCEVILKALTLQKGDAKRFAQSHVAAILEILTSNETGLSAHVPGKITVLKHKNSLEFKLH